MFKLPNKTQKLLKSIQNFNSKFAESGNNTLVKIEDKVKGTFMEKWLKYWKGLLNDYRDVAIDVYKDVKTKPAKAAAIGSTFGIIYYCAIHNPDEKSFRDAYLRAANEVLLVNPSMQNPMTVSHLRYIEQAYNHKLIRRLNFGIGSIVWVDLYSETSDIYEAHCDYLQLSYTEFGSRILDIGFLDRWWVLSKKMIDFDVSY